MSKHIADHRAPSKGGKLRAFFQIARSKRETFHRSESLTGGRRLVEFLRIARGRTV